MSDTKLRPEDLTSEERAIVDNAALFYRRVTGAVGETAEWAYVEALKEAEPIILARRALFAPAPEKVAKVETMADRIAADLKAGTFRGEQPAPPEPAAPSWMKVSCMGDVDAGKEDLLCPPPDPKSCWVCRQHEEHCCPEPEPATPVAYTCPNCNRPTKSPNGHAISGATVFSPAEFTCKPAQPEPAAREMPEAVRDAVDTLRSGVPSYPTWRQYADTLESWWRNLAQPVAVGMTEELEHVLSIAERDIRYKVECFDNSARTVHDERIERLRAAIAAVRQQAAQVKP